MPINDLRCKDNLAEESCDLAYHECAELRMAHHLRGNPAAIKTVSEHVLLPMLGRRVEITESEIAKLGMAER